VRTILLLTVSNIFMTFAWYGHLKYPSEALWKVIFASWGGLLFLSIVSRFRLSAWGGMSFRRRS
jgi:uncharacterized protein (DUF486 family)